MLDRLEKLLEWGGTRRKVALLSVSGLALLMSMLGMEPLPFEVSWIAIVLCGVPVVLEAVLGLATADHVAEIEHHPAGDAFAGL